MKDNDPKSNILAVLDRLNSKARTTTSEADSDILMLLGSALAEVGYGGLAHVITNAVQGIAALDEIKRIAKRFA